MRNKNFFKKIILSSIFGACFVAILLLTINFVRSDMPPPPHTLPCYQLYDNQKGTAYDIDFTTCSGEYTLNNKAEFRNNDLKLKYQWSNLTKVGELSTGGTNSVFVSGDYAYLGEAAGSTEKFIVVDISNQASSTEVASLDFSGEFVKEVNDIFVDGNYAYLAITQTAPSYSTYLKIIDISNPLSPTTTATYASYPSWPEWRTAARKIFVSGNYVYVTWNHGLEIIDVSDKQNPSQTYLFDSLSTNISYTDLFVRDDYLYVGFKDSNISTGGIKIYDISNPSEPDLKGEYYWSISGDDPPEHLYLEGNYLYLTHSPNFGESVKLKILNVINVSEPSLVTEINLKNSYGFSEIWDIFINNQKLFISGYNYSSSVGQLEVLNVSKPSNPTEIISTQSSDLDGVKEIFVSSESSLYSAHLGGALRIFRYGFLNGQSNYGEMKSFVVDPIGSYSENGSWDRIEINNTTSGQTLIYQILDENENLIPDSVLPGNSSGFVASSTTTTIDIHTINPTTYPKLILKAKFYTNDSFETPSLNSWKIYWIKAKGTQSATTINPGQSVDFDASDSIGDSLTYKWDFDKSDGYDWDNPDATGAQVSHTYSTVGNYIATLRIQQGTATAIDEKEFTITVTGGGGGGGGGGGSPPANQINRLTLNTTSTQLNADNKSEITLTAQLYDLYNQPFSQSHRVDFSLDNESLGVLSNSFCLTDTSGQCQITFKAKDKIGRAKITACVLNQICDEIIISLIEPLPIISLTKSVDSAGKVYPGQILTYRIDYKNNGDQAVILKIQDKISLGTSYVLNSLVIDGQRESDEAEILPQPEPLPKHGDYNQTVNGGVYFYLGLVEPGQSGYVSYQIKVDENYLDKYYYSICRSCQCLIGPIEKIEPIELESNYFRIQAIQTPPTILPVYCPNTCLAQCLYPSEIINQSKGIYTYDSEEKIVYSNLISNQVVSKLDFISKIELKAEPDELLADGKSESELEACIYSEDQVRIQAVQQPQPVILPVLPDLSGIPIGLSIIEGSGKLVSGAKSYLTDKNGCVKEIYQAGQKDGLVKIKAEVMGSFTPIEIQKQSELFDIAEIKLLPVNRPRIKLILTPNIESYQVKPNQEISYRLDYQNIGNQPAVDPIFKFKINSLTNYQANSLIIDGQEEDDDGDDPIPVSVCTKVGNFNVSEKDTITVIFSHCQIQPNEKGYLSFGIKIKPDASIGSRIVDQAKVNYSSPLQTSYSNRVILNISGSICGNNLKEEGEECDGTDLAGKKCLDFGYGGGTLSCRTNCTFDTSLCLPLGGGGGGGQGPSVEQPVQEQPIQEQPVEEQPVQEQPIQEISKPSPTIQEKIVKIIQPITRVYQKIKNNPTVQVVNQAAVVPLASVGALTNLATSLPTASSGPDLLKYFLEIVKLLFTQPAMLLAVRRKKWGTIYHALTKYPIALATVRLYEIIDGQKKLIQTKVTGPDGRYFFLVIPGKKYQIEVSSSDYNFPTQFLKDRLIDEPFDNLYFGQEFIAPENGLINFNIPLDPKENRVDIVGSQKKIQIKPGLEEKEEYELVKKEMKRRKTALIFASIAPFIALICFIVSPGLYTGILLAVHLLIWLIFNKFIRAIKPKAWGKTYELETLKPVGQTLVRLFAKQFDKLVAVQISDNLGRYGFLISGQDDYYLVPHKPNYIFPQGKLEVSAKEKPLVAKDLGLRKQ